ncbi:MAG: hypothetical protein FWC65_06585 [Treponema sp.]|nr:hypothetical protein [Treponema sp.]
MMDFVNDLLLGFRPCFSRNATFEWFVVIIAGLLVRTDSLGVTSVIRGLLLTTGYMGLIGFFRSSAWILDDLIEKWCELVRQNAPLVKYGDAVVMVGDGVKEPKEGRRMPGVKRLHQESDNSSKPEFIWGHLFGGVGILAEKAGKCFCIPLAMLLQDGVKTIFGWEEPKQRQASHVVEMIGLSHKLAKYLGKTILLLDRYFLSVPALLKLDELNDGNPTMHIVTKAKRNCTAFQQLEIITGKRGRGRPRKKGASVKLHELFESAKAQFCSAEVRLYGEFEHVRYHCVDLLWGKELYKTLRFVLVEYNRTQTILVSTDLAMEPLDIIQLYGRRFGIEVMFREMKQVANAFGYRFWSQHMPKLNRFKKKTDTDPIEQVIDPHKRERISLAVKAIEGFMFCSAVATGLLQMISLIFSGTDELTNLRWLRTYRNAVVSEATVADFFRRNFLALLHRRQDLPLAQIISAKQGNTIDQADLNRAA